MTGLLSGVGSAVPPHVPPAAGTGETVSGALLAVFILFIGAKAGEELLRRLGQPGVIGELIGGFIVGPHALALVVPGEVSTVLGELGVVVLLFTVGLEVRTDDLLAVGRPAVATALIAMVLPIVAAAAMAGVAGDSAGTSAIIGLALAATSIGITSRVLAELHVLDRAFSRVILGAAIVDDVLALVAIGIVSGVVTGDVSESTWLVAVAAIGMLALGFAAARRVRGMRREVFTWPLFADTPLVPSFMLMLAMALLAAAIGLAAIIGAFVAGLILAETEAREELEDEMRPLAQIFTPFFFAVTGAQVDLGALADPGLATFAILLGVVGVLTKALGGYLGARRLGRWNAVVVGVGMAPRGEVGIVVVNLGAGLGLLDPARFSAVLVAVVITTLAAPLLLAWAIPRATRGEGRVHPQPESAEAG